MAAKDPRVIFTAAGIEAFTGRDWLAGEVDRFMTENRCGYVFIEAEAGLGKTAFAAWLVKNRGYLSHFSRYSGGRSVRTALRNLSAQLITSYSLDDQAPGGVLQEWAEEPAWFESLLGKAADVAGVRQQRLVIVVDGLDEAEPAEGELSFGLPGFLPDGVYVIGTHQTGHWPGQPESPARTLPIRQHDPRNKDDVGLYLARAVAEDVLAAQLASGGVDPAAFVEVLSARCDGVWVYLRYILQELRLGLRNPNELGDLPSGVQDYYAAQIRRWRHDLAWDSELLPLLATLGVAGEALPAAALARLAGGLDPLAAQRRLDLTFRPLLNASPVAETKTMMQYEIYHASFRDVLNAQHSPERVGHGAGRSYESLVLADGLRQATLTAHSRAADVYLDSFGGLDANLPVLAADPSASKVDGGYPLRHLARHLYHADRLADLHRLLAALTTANNGRAINVWFAAHEHANSLANYIEDLGWARGGIAAVRPLLERLPNRGKRILLLRSFSKMTQSQISAELGISRSQVSRELTRTFAQLREGLTTEE